MSNRRGDQAQIEASLACWEERALAATSAGDHQKALEAHGQALALAARLGRPRLLAALYNRLGNALEAANQVQQSVIAYESGLRALAAGSGLDAGSGLGHADKEIEAVIGALGSAAKGFDPSRSLVDVPDLYSQTTASDLGQAEADEALPAKLLINVGNAYLRQPQLGPALTAYGQALVRPEIEAAPLLRAYTLTHIGIIRRQQGSLADAEAALQDALELFDQQEALGGDVAEKRRALAALAGIHRERGRFQRALGAYREALSLYEASDDILGHGRAQAGLGHLYLQQHRHGQALTAFARAVALAKRAADEETLWHAYWGLGTCQHAAGELDAAAGSLQHALTKIKARRRQLRTDEGKVTFLQSVQEVFDQLIEIHLDRAVSDPAAYWAALAVIEDARAQALYDLMGMRRRQFASQQLGYRETRLRWSPGQRRDSPQQVAPGTPSGGDLSSMVAQMAPGTPSGSGLSSMVAQMAPGVESVARPNLGQLLDTPLWDEDLDPLVGYVEAAPPAASDPPFPPEETGSAASPSSPTLRPLARLVFHTLPRRTAVLAIVPDSSGDNAATSGKLQGHVAAAGHDELAQRVAALRQALEVDDAPRGVKPLRDARRRQPQVAGGDPEPLLRALYADLVEPLAGALPSDGTPVVIEPHGPLWLLPFAALQAADGTWLADQWPLLHSPSAEVLDEIRREPDYGTPGELSTLVVGNPAMPPLVEQGDLAVELAPLPGAEVEARAIAGIFPAARTTLLLGDAADWASVVAQMPLHGIVHLSTHGLANADKPLDSFIVLGPPGESTLETLAQLREQTTGWSQFHFLRQFLEDQGHRGLLTAEQILYLPLPADLVTLSACQTGLGQISGDGVIGLARSFLVAGARAVLVSQWSVSDAATAELMLSFYRYYVNFDDKALALQRAMQDLRAMPEYDHPRYWAPFVIVGAEA